MIFILGFCLDPSLFCLSVKPNILCAFKIICKTVFCLELRKADRMLYVYLQNTIVYFCNKNNDDKKYRKLLI